MGYELIICGVLLIAIFVFVQHSHHPKSPPVFHPPPTEKKVEVKPSIPLPQQMRRWQQSLKHREKDVFDREEYQTYKEREMDLKERGVSLERKEVELTDLLNAITNERTAAQLENQQMRIELDGQRIEVKELLMELQQRENLLEIGQKQLTLDGKKVELKELLAQIWHEGNQVELSKKELVMMERELEFNYQRKAFDLEQTAQHIKNMMVELHLDKKRWGIEKAQQTLEIYNQKLNLLEKTIASMFDIRMKWLQIQDKENNLSNREAGLKLQRWDNDLRNKEHGLQLQRWDNSLFNREERLDLRRYDNDLRNREQKLGLQRWDNSLFNREQKLDVAKEMVRLQSQYEKTNSKIRELHIDKQEVNLLWNKRDLDNRWKAFNDMKNTWLLRLR